VNFTTPKNKKEARLFYNSQPKNTIPKGDLPKNRKI
jgi:hypothetical protein